MLNLCTSTLLNCFCFNNFSVDSLFFQIYNHIIYEISWFYFFLSQYLHFFSFFSLSYVLAKTSNTMVNRSSYSSQVYHYHILPCIMCTHIFGPNFQEKIFCFNFKIQCFIYLQLETKPIIIFQGISLHMDIIIVFQSYTFNA